MGEWDRMLLCVRIIPTTTSTSTDCHCYRLDFSSAKNGPKSATSQLHVAEKAHGRNGAGDEK